MQCKKKLKNTIKNVETTFFCFVFIAKLTVWVLQPVHEDLQGVECLKLPLLVAVEVALEEGRPDLQHGLVELELICPSTCSRKETNYSAIRATVINDVSTLYLIYNCQ